MTSKRLRRGVQLSVRSDLVGGSLRAHQGCARRGDIAEDSLLLNGIAFDGLHEVRDEVRATLQNDVHLSPRRVHSLSLNGHLISPADVGGAQDKCQDQ